MRNRKLAYLLLAGSVGLAGCGDVISSDSSPMGPGGAPSLAASATTDRHTVVFADLSVPGDFVSRVQALGGSVVDRYDAIGAATVTGLTSATAAELQRSSGVRYVEPEVLVEMDLPVTSPLAEPAIPTIATATKKGGSRQTTTVAVEPLANNDAPANAARFSWQWNMMAVDADAAWAAGHLGSPAVTVAILDTGIDYLHADLKGRVDLARSVSFLPEEDAVVAQYFPGRHPVTDLQYHGTHVAATVTSNAAAAAGVTSKLTLMGVKVCRSGVPGLTARGCPGGAIFGGLLYAADNGAEVINMSLGGVFAKSDYPGYVSVINRIINYVHSKNVTLVVSAGNSNLDLDHDGDSYKTYCSAPHVLCISATGPTSSAGRAGPWTDIDAKAYYSNYGRSSISVAAPGGNSGGSVWAACSTSSLIVTVCQTGTYVVGLSGTSMASPHTAGLAGLLVERHGKDPGAVKSVLQNSAEDLGAVGTDPTYGKGRINVARAVGAS